MLIAFYSALFLEAARVSDSVTRRIGAANVGLRYLAMLNKLTRPTSLPWRSGFA